MVAVFLRSRIEKLRNDNDGKLLSVLAFASPPSLDLASALACEKFCLTVVNNVVSLRVFTFCSFRGLRVTVTSN